MGPDPESIGNYYSVFIQLTQSHSKYYVKYLYYWIIYRVIANINVVLIPQGDGGGPMMVKQNTRWIQAGVSSFISAQGCAKPNIADGYARVSRYQSWIKRHITSNQPGFVYNSSNVISGRSNIFSLFLLSILPLLFSL